MGIVNNLPMIFSVLLSLSVAITIQGKTTANLTDAECHDEMILRRQTARQEAAEALHRIRRDADEFKRGFRELHGRDLEDIDIHEAMTKAKTEGLRRLIDSGDFGKLLSGEVDRIDLLPKHEQEKELEELEEGDDTHEEGIHTRRRRLAPLLGREYLFVMAASPGFEFNRRNKKFNCMSIRKINWRTGLPKAGESLRLVDCYQAFTNSMSLYPSAAGPAANEIIAWQIPSNWFDHCLSAKSLEVGEKFIVEPCDLINENQLWKFPNDGTIRSAVDESLCCGVHSSNAAMRGHGVIKLQECGESLEERMQQTFEFCEFSSRCREDSWGQLDCDLESAVCR